MELVEWIRSHALSLPLLGLHISSGPILVVSEVTKTTVPFLVTG